MSWPFILMELPAHCILLNESNCNYNELVEWWKGNEKNGGKGRGGREVLCDRMKGGGGDSGGRTVSSYACQHKSQVEC